MERPSKTAKSPRSWSTMVGMRPFGLRSVYHGCFWMFLPMWMLCTVYSLPYASLSSSSRMDALTPLGVPERGC